MKKFSSNSRHNVQETTSIKQAQEIMTEDNIGTIAVRNPQQEVVGTITENKIDQASHKGVDLCEVEAKQVMEKVSDKEKSQLDQIIELLNTKGAVDL